MASIKAELDIALPCLVKAVFSQCTDKSLSPKITVRPVIIKRERIFQVEEFRDNKAYQKNINSAALLQYADDTLDGKYRQGLIITQSETRQYTLKLNGSYKCTSKNASVGSALISQGQNREKKYILSEGEHIPALVDLGIFNSDFQIVKSKYDKYKQINRFIQLIDDEFKDEDRDEITILDFGCGKSYLTFIMYYYFTEKCGIKTNIIGYDLKRDVVENCNQIARKYGYDRLKFVVSDVTRDVLYDRHIDMIVTLHACDVATDYALNYAILHNVKHIFSVPCCQHEINAQIKSGGELDIFLSYGLIKERMSALLTDAIRGRVLEAMGYEVDMIEFIDFEHSPKNLMIRAAKKHSASSEKLSSAYSLCKQYNFTQTLLELIKNN